MSNPRDLLLAQLGDILWVERMLVFEVLPKLVAAVRSEALVHALEAHLAQTRAHVSRVEQTFRSVGAEPSSALSQGFEGLRKAHAQTAAKISEPGLGDVFHALAAVHTEHYELAAYAGLIALADSLGERDAPRLLGENLKEEQGALKQLEGLARALAAETSGR